MLLYKTTKAHQELMPGSRSLNLRQRSLLLLAEGTPYIQLAQMYHGQGEALVGQLLESGYLESRAMELALPLLEPTARPEPPRPAEPAAPPVMTLAGTRMYLFDMVERLFANRQQSVAEQLRQALREARDVQALRSVCDALLNAVAQHAGAQRAMQLSQQLVHLVPDWSLESHDHAP
jgi:hypothetical protein